VKGRPWRAAPSNPLVQKGWDTESLSGFMDHILLQIKGRLRANGKCHCLGFATVASSPPKQDGTQPTQRLKAWEITTRENFPFRSSRRPAG